MFPVDFQKSTSPLFAVFCTALFFRLAAIPTSLLRLNPYSQADAVGFGSTAQFIAAELSLASPASRTYELWGVVLAPFWFLPGPSSVYAHLFVALLGSLAVYNIAVLGYDLHSQRAGAIAALPAAVYPSIVLTHSTLLREAGILFGITTAARVIVSPSSKLPRRWAAVIATAALLFSTIQRPENLVIYLFAIVSGAIAYGWKHKLTKTTTGLLFASSPVFINYISTQIVAQINRIRQFRGHGRAAYLESVLFNNLIEIIAFSWIGALYFLFTPFPWMVEEISDLPVAVESLGNVCFTIAALFGFRHLLQRRPSIAIGLGGGSLLGIVLYGLGTVNYGTGVRHRPMFLWVIFLLGAIGFCSRIRVVKG